MCVNGTTSSPSVCSYNGSIDFSINSGDKDPNKNSMTLVYDIELADVLLSQNNGSTNLSEWIKFPGFSSGVSIKSATIDPQTKQLVIELDYSQDLQDQ